MIYSILSICISIISLAVAFFVAAHNYSSERRKRKRFQANNISCWIGRRNSQSGNISLVNNTPIPVYNVIVTIVFIQGAGPKKGETISSSWKYRFISDTLPPGAHSCFINFDGLYGMHAHFGVEIAFTDSVGCNWVRRAQGNLMKIKKTPFEFYSLTAPYEYRGLL